MLYFGFLWRGCVAGKGAAFWRYRMRHAVSGWDYSRTWFYVRLYFVSLWPAYCWEADCIPSGGIGRDFPMLLCRERCLGAPKHTDNGFSVTVTLFQARAASRRPCACGMERRRRSRGLPARRRGAADCCQSEKPVRQPAAVHLRGGRRTGEVQGLQEKALRSRGGTKQRHGDGRRQRRGAVCSGCG